MNFRDVALLFTLIIIAYAVFKLWKAFDTPDGERYLKRRMQGPFVPVSRNDAASDSDNKFWS